MVKLFNGEFKIGCKFSIGISESTNENTACETAKIFINAKIEGTLTEAVAFLQKIDDNRVAEEEEEDVEPTVFDSMGICDSTTICAWIQSIDEEAKQKAASSDDGDRDNILENKEYAKLFCRLCNALPLFSAISNKFFESPNLVGSSWSSETYFKNMRQLHGNALPCSADVFIKRDLELNNSSVVKASQNFFSIQFQDLDFSHDDDDGESNDGTQQSGTVHAQQPRSTTQKNTMVICSNDVLYDIFNANQDKIIDEKGNLVAHANDIWKSLRYHELIDKKFTARAIHTKALHWFKEENRGTTTKQNAATKSVSSAPIAKNTIASTDHSQNKCIVCSNGHEPDGAHKCDVCDKPVHIFDGCSVSIGGEEGYGQKRKCMDCHLAENVEKGNNMKQVLEAKDLNHEETWKRTSKSTNSKYATPAPNWNLIPLNQKVKIGRLVNENSKTTTYKIGKKQVSFSNSCAIDTGIQLIATAIAYNPVYRSSIANENDGIFEIAKGLTTGYVLCYDF